MTDPLGLIPRVSPLPSVPRTVRDDSAGTETPDFKQLLQQQIQQVNELQNDATTAIEDLAAGRRDDLESVISATQKADLAFKMLLQVRNKVMDAYEEVKQIRI